MVAHQQTPVYPVKAFDMWFSQFSDKRPLCVSVVGSGGKTTTIEHLACAWAGEDYSVLVATTTKMWHPFRHSYPFDDFAIFDACAQCTVAPQRGRAVLFGIYDRDEEKITAADNEALQEIASRFDRVLIESDGCRNLPLVYHKPTEPAIPSWSDAIVAVMGLGALGKPVNDHVMYNYDLFARQHDYRAKKVTASLYRLLIQSPNGVLKQTTGHPTILMCNQSDLIDENQIKRMKSLTVSLAHEQSFDVIGGSWFTNRIDW